VAPSPIAPPTSFTEPERTSPTATTLGTFLERRAKFALGLRGHARRRRAGQHELSRVERNAATTQPPGSDELLNGRCCSMPSWQLRQDTCGQAAGQLTMKLRELGMGPQFDVGGSRSSTLS